MLVFVAMWVPVNRVCDSVYTKINHIKHLLCDSVWYNLNHTLSTGSKQIRHKNSEARGCDNTNGPLTTSVITSNEVAMSNRTTPPAGRASLSPNLFLWRFWRSIATTKRPALPPVCRGRNRKRSPPHSGAALHPFAGRTSPGSGGAPCVAISSSPVTPLISVV